MSLVLRKQLNYLVQANLSGHGDLLNTLWVFSGFSCGLTRAAKLSTKYDIETFACRLDWNCSKPT